MNGIAATIGRMAKAGAVEGAPPPPEAVRIAISGLRQRVAVRERAATRARAMVPVRKPAPPAKEAPAAGPREKQIAAEIAAAERRIAEAKAKAKEAAPPLPGPPAREEAAGGLLPGTEEAPSFGPEWWTEERVRAEIEHWATWHAALWTPAEVQARNISMTIGDTLSRALLLASLSTIGPPPRDPDLGDLPERAAARMGLWRYLRAMFPPVDRWNVLAKVLFRLMSETSGLLREYLANHGMALIVIPVAAPIAGAVPGQPPGQVPVFPPPPPRAPLWAGGLRFLSPLFPGHRRDAAESAPLAKAGDALDLEAWKVATLERAALAPLNTNPALCDFALAENLARLSALVGNALAKALSAPGIPKDLFDLGEPAAKGYQQLSGLFSRWVAGPDWIGEASIMQAAVTEEVAALDSALSEAGNLGFLPAIIAIAAILAATVGVSEYQEINESDNAVETERIRLEQQQAAIEARREGIEVPAPYEEAAGLPWGWIAAGGLAVVAAGWYLLKGRKQ